MQEATIIVPVYNAENYLGQCFASLRRQSVQNFRVLIVNDGSTDGSQKCIDAFTAENPSRYHAIVKPNGGYGSSIKTGIRNCETPYFMILDPDDTLKETAVEKLCRMAEVSGSDLVIRARMDQYSYSRRPVYDCCYQSDRTTLQKDTVYNRHSDHFSDLFLVDPRSQAKLYRRSCAEGIRFASRISYADHMLFWLTLLRASKVIYTDEPLAVYRKRRLEREEDIIGQMKGEIFSYRKILSQSQHISDVPEIFYWRMFAVYLDIMARLDGIAVQKEQKQQLLDDLDVYRCELAVYASKIRGGARQAGVPFQERVRHEVMLSKAGERMMALKKKKLQ
ncbi:MAG: glycosyltransferase family 2 protein [Lactimicrobium sp.]|jgi:glycosyltransferase involved in cell wall biosynthesis|uniref:glycosyltransferase family 2 protein n=2 Tax=Lactimicrobium sp. TaxID=2563780 RepID=UPI002F3565D7